MHNKVKDQVIISNSLLFVLASIIYTEYRSNENFYLPESYNSRQ